MAAGAACRCEPWGTASFHVVMWGCAVVLAAPCSTANLQRFVQWLTEPDPAKGNFPANLDTATLIVVRAGMSLLLPSGYMYTSFSVGDTCMVRWNLHTLAQLRPALLLLHTLKRGLPTVQCLSMQMQQSRYFAWDGFMRGLWAYVREAAMQGGGSGALRVRPLRHGQLTPAEQEGLQALRKCLTNNQAQANDPQEAARLLAFIEDQETGRSPPQAAQACCVGVQAMRDRAVQSARPQPDSRAALGSPVECLRLHTSSLVAGRSRRHVTRTMPFQAYSGSSRNLPRGERKCPSTPLACDADVTSRTPPLCAEPVWVES